MADVPGKFYRATKVRTGVSPSSPGAIEGEVTPPLNPPGGGLNSVGLTMPSAFNVSNSPLTSNGSLDVTGAGTTAQYIRGDGSLASFPSLTGFVPYTGATQNVDLGEYGVDAGFVNLDTTPTNTPTTQGTIYWDDSRSTAALIMNGTLQHIGQDTFFYVKNSTGSSIPKGTCVRFAGTDGASGHLLITPFLADGSVPSSYFMGVTSETISNGGFGQVMQFGELDGINTSGFTAGALLYASTTVAGGFQTTAPIAPNNIVLVAAAINSKNNGAIIVRPQIGSNINNDEGVKIVSPTTGQLLQLQSNGLWENKTKAQVLGGTSSQFVKGDGSLDSTTYQSTADKGQPNGYASLDGNGKVPLTQINDALIGNVNFQGLWNASTNTPTLANPPASGTKGYYYIVSTGGTFAGISFEVGDWIISNGSSWGKVDNTDAVSSVFGRTGNVVAANGDYNTSQVTESGNLYFTQARVSANTDVAANTAARHNAVTLGTANGLSLNVQQLSLGLASGSATGALSSTDWTTFNNKQNALTNPVTGTGSSGQVAYWSSGSAITGESNLFWDATNNRLGINNSTPEASLDLGNTGGQKFYTYNGGSGNRNGLGLDLGGNSYELSVFFAYGTSDNGRITFGSLNGSTYSTKMTILGNGNVNIIGNLTANSFVKSGGTSSQYLMADGSVSTLSNPVTGTGTTNYLPKFTGSTTIGNSNLINDASGNLGLGVTPPAWSLFRAINVLNGSFSTNSIVGGGVVVARNWYYDGGERYYENGTAQRLELVSNGFFFQTATTNSSGAGAALTWGSPMTLNSSGNLLIGTTSDNGARLQVSGDGHFTGSSGFNRIRSTNTATTGFSGAAFEMYVHNGSSVTYSGGMFQTNSTFAYQQISANQTNIYGFQSGGMRLATGTAPIIFATGNADLDFSQARMTITPGGNVGIGTNSPSTKFHVQNSININDALGLLLIENTAASTNATSNSSVNVKNYSGTSQFMQWESFGLRFGNRLITNSGQGNLYLTAGADSVAMTLRANGNIQIGGEFADNGYKFQNAGSSVLAGQVVQGGGTGRSTNGTTVAFTGNSQTIYSTNSDPGDGGRFLSIVNENTSTNAFSALSFRVNPSGGSNNAMLDMKFVNLASSNSSNLVWSFLHNGSFTDRMLLTSSGNLLIGTTTDNGNRLRVNGNAWFDGEVAVNAITCTSGNTNTFINPIGTTGIIYSGQGTTAVHQFLVNSGERFAVTNTGIRTIAPTGGTAVPWRLGTSRGGTVTSNATVRIEIDGVLVDLVARYV